MLFSAFIKFAFVILAPLGAASMLVGDWLLNAFIAAKIIETIMPNGPAIVGNILTIFRVLFTLMYNAVEPILTAVFIRGVIVDMQANMELGQWANNFTQEVYQIFGYVNLGPEL